MRQTPTHNSDVRAKGKKKKLLYIIYPTSIDWNCIKSQYCGEARTEMISCTYIIMLKCLIIVHSFEYNHIYIFSLTYFSLNFIVEILLHFISLIFLLYSDGCLNFFSYSYRVYFFVLIKKTDFYCYGNFRDGILSGRCFFFFCTVDKFKLY